MEIRVPRDDEIRAFVAELWLPYHRELQSIAERHELADDVDLVAEETAYRRDRFDEDGHRTWIAVDGDDFAGFLTADREGSPSVFARPDRLVVNDIFVREPYRGTGLATALLNRAADWAADRGLDELVLSVHVENDRARAFYRKHGFEPIRQRMAVPLDDL